MPPVCIYVLLKLPECQASIYAAKTAKHAGSWISATVLQGWITAIATVGLLIGAIVTAIYAARAFGKQSEQLRDQREIGALQAEDLRESLRERTRLRQVAERRQADQIGFRMTTIPFPAQVWDDDGEEFAVNPGVTVHMAIVSNESQRPIENVACRIGSPSDVDHLFPKTHRDLAVIVGRLAVPDPSGRWDARAILEPVPRSRALKIRPGERYGFVFEVNSHIALELAGAAARFTDDVGLYWQIDLDQHLKRLLDRDW
jgi:hypothetical protein